MPFKILDNYYDYKYYQEHPYIQIVTNKETRLFKIYSVYVEVNKEDNILILQTCSTHKDYKNYKDKFLLVIAKEVK